MENPKNLNTPEHLLDKENNSEVNGYQLLETIENKVSAGEQLSRDDLMFLYKIDSPNIDLTYEHPRIKNIRDIRDFKQVENDMPIVFECSSEQIAHKPEEINENSKAYVGPLKKGIFDLISKYNIENFYTSFPEGRIKQCQIKVGGKNKDQLWKELEDNHVISDNDSKFFSRVQSLLNSKEFITNNEEKQTNLFIVNLKEHLLRSNLDEPDIDELYQRAKDLGLGLCPAEVGPYLAMQYKPSNYLYIGMQPIKDFEQAPFSDRLFTVSWDKKNNQTELSSDSIYRLQRDSKFVFIHPETAM